tara:strand:- start:1323 stop:2189 length:867 start_codon:yes stop_codon:yes gene_type:complete
MRVDFFVVGAPKTGTTSLCHYLDEHPEIEMSSIKEPDYFSDSEIQNQGMYYGEERIDTIEKYHNLFNNTESRLKGEGSVSYLFYKNVPLKIKEYNPNAKIIIILRNPIERAFSHFLMDYRLGLTYNTFEEIVLKQSKHKYASLFYQQYIEVSEYTVQIKRYLECFPSKNILVIDYEDFKDASLAVINKIFLFLEVSTGFEPNIEKRYNTFSMPKNSFARYVYSFVLLRRFLKNIIPSSVVLKIRSVLFASTKKPIIKKETREFLRKHFKDDINALSILLSKDYSKWIK